MRIRLFRWTTRVGVWIQRAQYALIGLILLGALDYFAAYDLLIALFGTLGPGVAPLVLIVVLFLLYKGYRRSRRTRRGGDDPSR
ncbi:hypothetical protein [Cohnella zeiphila]|uniref:Uncharacterized protein n=1 Tax=Cohnella zeiphila TaxID=2761120 RepID=A0A7X0SPR3_9BACL|nr:hypothetical protein [Cohnella zeiphila]MBB6732630.1 hypothetical protein [Cohnella zeiphila]